MNRIYICCSTRNAVVNLPPVVEAGLRNLACIVVLVGAADPPEDIDKVNAVEPASHFAAVVRNIAADTGVKLLQETWRQHNVAVEEEAGRLGQLVRRQAGPTLIRIECSPAMPGAWSARVAAFAKELGAGEYVLNVTGGTAEMQFGALGGLKKAQEKVPGIRYATVKYQAQPPRLGHLYPEPSDVPDLIRHPGPTIEQMLALSGVRELGARMRDRRQRRAIARADMTRRISTFLAQGGPAEIVARLGPLHRFLHRLTAAGGGAGRHDQNVVVSVPKPPKDVGTSLQFFLGEAEASPGVLSLRSDDADLTCQIDDLRYLEAGWFEELIFLECRERFGDRVSLNVNLANRSGPDENAIGEIDVAIVVGWQIHVIECKTKSFAGRDDTLPGLSRDDIKRLSSLKRRVVGPVATAALLSFQDAIPQRRHFKAALVQEARTHGIEFWCGASGLDSLRTWLSQVEQCLIPV